MIFRYTSFMHFMEYRVPSVPEQIRHVLAISTRKTESRLVRHLSVEELQSILDAPSPSEPDGIRDRAMLHLCFATALRVSELVGLRLNDVTLQPQACVLIHGKGRRQRSTIVEGDGRSPEIMAGAETYDVRAGAIPQRSRPTHDASGFRICLSQARRHSDQAMSVTGD